MCVSGQFCEGHLLLLFNILEKSKDPSIRSNIVIALGDIAVSFGSLIDDVSPHSRPASLCCYGRSHSGGADDIRTRNAYTRVSPTLPAPSRKTR